MITQHYKGHLIRLRADLANQDGQYKWYAELDGTHRFVDSWDEHRIGLLDGKIEPPEEQYTLWNTPQGALAYAKRAIDYERGECNCSDCQKLRQGINPFTGEKL